VSEEKLKPCPFCGQTETVELEAESDIDIHIVCSIYKDGCGSGALFCRSKEEAVRAWNTRINPTPASNKVVISRECAELTEVARLIEEQRARPNWMDTDHRKKTREALRKLALMVYEQALQEQE